MRDIQSINYCISMMFDEREIHLRLLRINVLYSVIYLSDSGDLAVTTCSADAVITR